MGRLVDQLYRIHTAIRALDGNVVSFAIAPPASPQRVDAIEQRIGRAIPRALRQFFIEESSAIDIMWSVDRTGEERRTAMEDGFAGSFDLSLDGLPEVLDTWSGWRDTFAFPERHGHPPESNLAIHDALFPFVGAPNGDQIVLALDHAKPGDVIYLDHEGGEFDRALLASSLAAFLDVWIPLGCPGPEYWELEAFYDFDAQTLSLETPVSREWRKWLD